MNEAEIAPWEIFLAVGKNSLSGQIDLRESLFRIAVEFAESEFGCDSVQVGLCLIELADLLELSGQDAEAELLEERYRYILRMQAIKLGLHGKVWGKSSN